MQTLWGKPVGNVCTGAVQHAPNGRFLLTLEARSILNLASSSLHTSDTFFPARGGRVQCHVGRAHNAHLRRCHWPPRPADSAGNLQSYSLQAWLLGRMPRCPWRRALGFASAFNTSNRVHTPDSAPVVSRSPVPLANTAAGASSITCAVRFGSRGRSP